MKEGIVFDTKWSSPSISIITDGWLILDDTGTWEHKASTGDGKTGGEVVVKSGTFLASGQSASNWQIKFSSEYGSGTIARSSGFPWVISDSTSTAGFKTFAQVDDETMTYNSSAVDEGYIVMRYIPNGLYRVVGGYIVGNK